MPKKLHPICKTVGINLRRLRTDEGLTQTQAANMAGVHLRYIQDIEAGNRNPTAVVMDRLKIAFGCDWEDLLDAQKTKKRDK